MGFGMSAGRKGQGGFVEAVSARYPGLVGKAKKLIEESERAYTEKTGGPAGSFLWEHTLHVASLAFDLALAEGLEPILPAVAALFHDAGKFVGGEYHKGDRAEEEDSAALARSVLKREGAAGAFIAGVERALRSLYDEGGRRNPAADVIHDSDFLAKFGSLGVASFFIKSTLRGRNLDGAVINALSKELTYAAALPANMRTETGRKAAVNKSRSTLRFFRSLLRELRDIHGADYRIKSASIGIPGKRGGIARVRLVIPAACASCGGRWARDLSVEQGVKCRKLNVAFRCRGCGAKYDVSFCLPEIPEAGV